MTRSQFLTSLLFAAAFGASCARTPEAAADKPRALAVRTTAVERRDLVETLTLNGTLRPRNQVQVVSEVSARLLRVLRDEGARVGQGEVLATLDDTDYRLAHDRALAALNVAEANRAHAGVEKERADNLLKTGGVTDKDHLAAQVALQVAEAALGQVKAEAAIAATQHARTEIKAPFSGRVAKRLVDPGTMLSAGAPLLVLVDDAVLEFRAPVPSADYGRIKVGATAEVKVDSGRAVAGRVARISPLVEERTRAFEVTVEVPGGEALVGGLFARATLRLGTVTGALVVPPAALARDGADPRSAQVYVVEAGTARRRGVTLGTEAADAIQVVEGLAVGDVVVLDPPAALGDGTPVEAQARPAGK